MRVDVGPVEPVSAEAWIEWVRPALGELDAGSESDGGPPGEVLTHLLPYLEQWATRNGATGETLRWTGDIDPDELEYLVHAFHRLDGCLSPPLRRGQDDALTDEGRLFYLVLLHALLHALESESPSRAAFVDQLRSSWPSAAEAC